MQKINQKVLWTGLLLLVIIAILALLAWRVFFSTNQYLSNIKDVQSAANLQDYLKNNQFLADDQEKELELSTKEVSSPVPVKIPLDKITMAPQGIEGGDSIYYPVIELPGNKFFTLSPDNYKNVFSVDTPQEAMKYVDFLQVTMGGSSYNRSRQTVWQTGDYDKIGCQQGSGTPAEPLPDQNSRKITEAKPVGDGFEVDWVFFSPAYPNGYYQFTYQVKKDGEIVGGNQPNKPFWPCNGGILF